jgi:hypothetical protein
LRNLAGEQRVPLGIEGRNVALGMLDLARDAEKLSGGAFPGDGGVDFAVIIKETLQSLRVSATVSLIGACHQQGEVLLLGIVAREVGVDALGDVAEEGLEAGRRVELFGFVGIAKCSVMGLLRALARLFSSAAGGVGVVQVDLTLGDARFELVERGIEDADLAEVTAFESLELGADLGNLRFALGERSANGGQLLALVEEGDGVRGLLENDFGWHAASRKWKF